jgi:hypothetical protein
MVEARNAFPAPNSIRRYVQRELFRRRLNTQNSSLAIPTPTIMPFVRFTSTRQDHQNHYKFFHLGLHGSPGQDIPEAFGNIFEMSYGDRDIIGYGYGDDGKRKPVSSDQSTGTRNEIAVQGKHPIPGIIGIRVTHLGVNEPIQAVVEWICYNRTQLEFLRQHFLMAGGYVVVEFGHLFSNRIPTGIFDFSESDALEKLTQYVVAGRKAMSDDLFEPAAGNYNMIIGRVTDQSLEYVADGTIKCSTTVTSTGEAVFGIHNNKLMGRIVNKEDSDSFTRTISDFFQDHGRFDQMLSEPGRQKSVIDLRAESEDEVKNTTILNPDANDPSRNRQTKLFPEEPPPQILEKFAATDGRFIPWDMFLIDVLGELFSAVKNHITETDAVLFTRINDPTTPEPAVGNHPLLASTDPDTLVIVKPWMVQEGVLPEQSYKVGVDRSRRFAVSRPLHDIFFTSGSNEERGLLSNGVWIHVQAIKDAFSQQNTFYASVIQLLTRMNNATQNYWHLDLAFDEEIQQYKIYDKRGVFNSTTIPSPYVFNKGTRGELLDLSFTADFSKEAKSAILLASLPQLENSDASAANDGGTYNEPSWWTRVLNIPTLHDMLGESVNAVRNRGLGKTSTPARQPDKTGATRVGATQSNVTANQRADEIIARATLLSRFKNVMGAYIVLGTALIQAIGESGRKIVGSINNFVAPVPTEIQMSLTLQGISGMTFYDTFLVDKLPRIYEDHGVFLINALTHEVSMAGWKTTIGGLYYFVKMRGGAGAGDIAVEPTDEVLNLGNVSIEHGSGIDAAVREQQQKAIISGRF